MLYLKVERIFWLETIAYDSFTCLCGISLLFHAKVFARVTLTSLLKCCIFCRVYILMASTPRKIKHHSIYIIWLPLRPFFSYIPQNNTSMLSCFCLLLFSIQESRLITARYWMTTRCMRKLERGALAPSIWRPIARQTYNMPSSSWT